MTDEPPKLASHLTWIGIQKILRSSSKDKEQIEKTAQTIKISMDNVYAGIPVKLQAGEFIVRIEASENQIEVSGQGAMEANIANAVISNRTMHERATILIEEDLVRIMNVPAIVIEKHLSLKDAGTLMLSDVISIDGHQDQKITNIDPLGSLTYYGWSWDFNPTPQTWEKIWKDTMKLEKHLLESRA